ncbi:MAG: DUF1854 domain-containing protein [Giesbergeria sp.]|nr:DUF1854 domain-containing protein [Giesbergeria sp.]
MSMRTTDPLSSFQLERNAHGRLVLTLACGTTHSDVVPVRAFPIAAPDEGLSLIGSDGHELLWIERLADLAPQPRQLLQEELAAREFVPVIERICSVSNFSTPSTWTVETDRGRTQLVLKGEEDIRRLRGSPALLIAARDGVQYAIRDSGALDKASRRLLERFL